MAFNADQYFEALEPPTFVHNGRTFRGRVLSFEEWIKFEPRIRQSLEGKLDYLGIRALIRDLCDAFFPRGLRFWTPRVSKLILRMPLQGQMDAVRDFMDSQVKGLGLTTPGKQ